MVLLLRHLYRTSLIYDFGPPQPNLSFISAFTGTPTEAFVIATYTSRLLLPAQRLSMDTEWDASGTPLVPTNLYLEDGRVNILQANL